MAPAPSSFGRFHTPRLGARRASLAITFSIKAMESAWTTYVRDGLRKQEVLDLHDYLDFHRNRTAIFSSLHQEIIDGNYAPSKSLPIRIEKKNGVSRTLILPCPEDAIILQCIVETLYPAARKKQPSQNSFFSRSHGFNRPEMRFHRDYIWFRRWAQFSKLRFDMVSTHKFICVTDIANYFDNIDYRHLRNVVTTLDAYDEVLLDFLFLVLDIVSWRPDYLPSPGKSLPQVNFDAPRLLSHIFLFEVDDFLKTRTDDKFVRWVDDMTIAVDSINEGKRTLRDLDELLMTRGLRLNSGKTVILSASQAARYFWQDENIFLNLQKTKIDAAIKSGHKLSRIARMLEKRFETMAKKEKHGQWDKVVKRYIFLFAKLKAPYLLPRCYEWLVSEPALRDALWNYLTALGPDNTSFRLIRKYLISGSALDDGSLCEAANLFTMWPVEPRSSLHRRLRSLGRKLSAPTYVERSPFFFLFSLWVLGKYGRRSDVIKLIETHKDLWRTSSFLSRQVASILPKFRHHRHERGVRKLIETHKHPSATSVLLSLDKIAEAPLQRDLTLYAFNGRNRKQYTLQRFLICLHLLSSNSIPRADLLSLRKGILAYNPDPLYKLVLTSLKL